MRTTKNSTVKKNQIVRTRQLPRLGLVQLDHRDHLEFNLQIVHLPLQVVANELVVGGVEPEAGGQGHGAHGESRLEGNE